MGPAEADGLRTGIFWVDVSCRNDVDKSLSLRRRVKICTVF